MKEAKFFGDIVIVPYMDNYDLVVLKTVAICEYGVSGLIFVNLKLVSSNAAFLVFICSWEC